MFLCHTTATTPLLLSFLNKNNRERTKEDFFFNWRKQKNTMKGSVPGFLLLGKLSSDLVGQDFVPVQLVASDGQGTTKGLEGGVRELSVALVDGSLVLNLSLLHSLHKVAGELLQKGRSIKEKSDKCQSDSECSGERNCTFPLPVAVISTIFSVVSCTLPSS